MGRGPNCPKLLRQGEESALHSLMGDAAKNLWVFAAHDDRCKVCPQSECRRLAFAQAVFPHAATRQHGPQRAGPSDDSGDAPRSYLVDTDPAQGVGLVWAIRVSFLELLSYFPGAKDLFGRSDNRDDVAQVAGESLSPGYLARTHFGPLPLRAGRRRWHRRSTLRVDGRPRHRWISSSSLARNEQATGATQGHASLHPPTTRRSPPSWRA